MDGGRHHWVDVRRTGPRPTTLGIYNGPPQHATTLHAAFRCVWPSMCWSMSPPTPLSPTGGHGPVWQRRMNIWLPDWRERKVELGEVGRHAWLGDTAS